jgi:hypothetical protein
MLREVSIFRRGFVCGGLAATAQLASPLAARAEAKARTFVLVHGAWHGGSSDG